MKTQMPDKAEKPISRVPIYSTCFKCGKRFIHPSGGIREDKGIR